MNWASSASTTCGGRRDSAGWETVAAAEVRAAASSPPVEEVLRAIDAATAVAILTNNSEAAVAEFLKREPVLAAKVKAVVGRETLAGPKTDFEIFRTGIHASRARRSAAPTPISYVGDMSYELDFARQLGATAVDVVEFTTHRRALTRERNAHISRITSRLSRTGCTLESARGFE